MRLFIYEEMYSLSTKKVIICPPRMVFLVHQEIYIEIL